MVNCNPETVSTDYDTSDRLYFEPLGAEEVLDDLRARAARRRRHPVRRPDAAQARARDRGGRLPDPRHAVRRDRPRRGPRALRAPSATSSASRVPGLGDRRARRPRRSASPSAIGYPVLVRPSYVLGGRTMRVCYDAETVAASGRRRARASSSTASSRARSRSTSTRSATARTTYVAAVMQHVEEAGVHSGDSSCVLPPLSLDADVRARGRGRRPAARAGARRRRAPQRPARASPTASVFVLEANPRASRTVPFASKAIGVNLVDAACRLAAGRARSPSSSCPRRATAGAGERQGGRVPVRALPRRRPGARARDALDRRGDGERGRLPDRVREGRARRRAGRCPTAAPRSSPSATRTRPAVVPVAARARRARLRAASRPAGPPRALAAAGLAGRARPQGEGGGRGARRSSTSIRRGRCDLVVNTPQGAGARSDGYLIREAALVARDPVHHDAGGRGGGGRGDRATPAARARLPPGADRCAGASGLASSASSGRARTRSCAVERGRLEPGEPGPVLHARGARAAAAAADEPLPRAARRARVPGRPDRAGDAGARARSSRATRSTCSARSGTASGSTSSGRCSSAAASASRRFPYLSERSAARRRVLGFRTELARRGGRARPERRGRGRADARHRACSSPAATSSPAAPSRCSRPSRALAPRRAARLGGADGLRLRRLLRLRRRDRRRAGASASRARCLGCSR